MSGTATTLHTAAKEGDVRKVKTLLKDGKYDVNCTDKYGWTPLHWACDCGHVSVAKELINNKADINAKTYQGNIPLRLAADKGHNRLAAFLITEFDCDIDFSSVAWLHIACKKGNVRMAEELLLKHGADITAKDCNNNTPLQVAALNGKDEVALLLINVFHCDITVKGNNDKSLLHYACCGGSVNLVRTLIINYGADVTAKDDNNNTPLQEAVYNGHTEVALLLITEFHCDVKIKDTNGRSLLHIACSGDARIEDNVNLVRTLVLKHGADFTARDDRNDTPLHVALMHHKFKVVQLLSKEFKYSLSASGFKGRSVLHLACKDGSERLICDLIQYGADVTARDDNNDSPLHVAAEYNNDGVVQILINTFKVSLLDTNSDGNTPLHVCATMGHTRCVKIMLAANPPILLRNNAGKKPEDLAQIEETKLLFDEYMRKNREAIYHEYNILQKRARKRYSTAEHITRIFVIGNPGAGKSTLVESLKREGFFNFRRVSESSVPPHTAGIVPSVHSSKHYGRVLFYDFAGDAEYYSSHAAILENFSSTTKGDNIFVIVIDLREDRKDSAKSLSYWCAFIQHQKFGERSPQVIIAGSHSDKVTKKDREVMSRIFQDFCDTQNLSSVKSFSYLMLDCGLPKSNQIQQLQRKIISITENSPFYKLSIDASILLGLLEKDFQMVTTCFIKDILSHVQDTNVPLSTTPKFLNITLNELHELGLLLNLKGSELERAVVLNTSTLTNEVHQRLFSDEAEVVLKDIAERKKVGGCFNIGIIPESVLKQILPESIPTECLVQLQYCQEINCKDVADIPDFLPASSTSDHTFLFFPALCTADKSDVSWTTHDDRHYSIGWLARCTDPCHFFPPRFLHVLLLRVVFRFTLSAPTHSQAITEAITDSPHQSYFQRRCTMWKTGVHWLMEEGVECLVELVSINRVVVITKSQEEYQENCISVFNRVVSCVVEAKAEFCHSIKPQFFLLNSTESSDYLSESNLFAMSEVEKILSSGKDTVVSSDGKSFLPRKRILFLHKLTHWDSLFPLDFPLVLQLLHDVVDELFELGLQLNISSSYLRALEMNFSTNFDRARRELVREWLSSSLDPPCWYCLVQALRAERVGRGDIANTIERKYDSHVRLEKSLLSAEKQSLKPEEEFLEEFAGVVESKWPALASVLSLTSAQIEELKKRGEELSQKESALQMLRQWTAKEDSTYGQLCQRLKNISLFQW